MFFLRPGSIVSGGLASTNSTEPFEGPFWVLFYICLLDPSFKLHLSQHAAGAGIQKIRRKQDRYENPEARALQIVKLTVASQARASAKRLASLSNKICR